MSEPTAEYFYTTDTPHEWSTGPVVRLLNDNYKRINSLAEAKQLAAGAARGSSGHSGHVSTTFGVRYVYEVDTEVPVDLEGATDVGEENAYPANAGQFAARWNAFTPEERDAQVHHMTRNSQHFMESFLGNRLTPEDRTRHDNQIIEESARILDDAAIQMTAGTIALIFEYGALPAAEHQMAVEVVDLLQRAAALIRATKQAV